MKHGPCLLFVLFLLGCQHPNHLAKPPCSLVYKTVYLGIYLFQAGDQPHQVYAVLAPPGATVDECSHVITDAEDCFITTKQEGNACISYVDCIENSAYFIGAVILESSGYERKNGEPCYFR